MTIIIQNRSELPIYAQIEAQLREQILDGTLPEGTALPSIRKLAKETGVSVITTTRAYSDLEAEGFITSIPGKGSIVRPRDNALLREQQLRRIEEHLTPAITVAKAMQLERAEFDAVVDALWADE